jgi:hypothetical protein
LHASFYLATGFVKWLKKGPGLGQLVHVDEVQEDVPQGELNKLQSSETDFIDNVILKP